MRYRGPAPVDTHYNEVEEVESVEESSVGVHCLLEGVVLCIGLQLLLYFELLPIFTVRKAERTMRSSQTTSKVKVLVKPTVRS